MIDNELLKILVCPACKSDLNLDENKLVCTSCLKQYAIRDGIPLLLIDNPNGE